MAHDASLPAEEPSALFAGFEPETETETETAPVRMPVPAVIADPRNNIRCPRCEGKRRVQVQPIWPNNAPPAWIQCPRCAGCGATVAYQCGPTRTAGHVEPEQTPTTAQKAQVIA